MGFVQPEEEMVRNWITVAWKSGFLHSLSKWLKTVTGISLHRRHFRTAVAFRAVLYE